LSHNETRLDLLHVAYCDKSHNGTRFILLHVAFCYMHRFDACFILLHGGPSQPQTDTQGTGSNRQRFKFEPKPVGLN